MFKIFFSLFFIFLLASCSPATIEDLRVEGEAEVKKLTKELKGIETKEQLQKALPKIRRRFLKIADLLVEVKRIPHSPREPMEASERLFIEMARLYEIPGARELIEEAEAPAVSKIKSAAKLGRQSFL